MTTALCWRCRLIRPMGMLTEDPETRTLLHAEHCPLPGGLLMCDPNVVACGDTRGATGRLAQGARIVPV